MLVIHKSRRWALLQERGDSESTTNLYLKDVQVGIERGVQFYSKYPVSKVIRLSETLRRSLWNDHVSFKLYTRDHARKCVNDMRNSKIRMFRGARDFED